MATLLPCDALPDPISLGEAQVILWSTIIVVIMTGTIHAWYSVGADETYGECMFVGSDTQILQRSAGEFFAGNGSYDWRSLGFSFLSSSLGQWVLCFVPYLGYNLGWLGIFSLILGWGGSMFAIYHLAPIMTRQMRAEKVAFYAVTDWIRVRYSPTFQNYVCFIILCIMLLFAGTELAALASIYNASVEHGSRDDSVPILVIVGVMIGAMVCCALSGFASAVFNQMAQSFVVMTITIFIVLMIFITDEQISAETVAVASAQTATAVHFRAAITTMLMNFFANLLNFVFWQKILSSDDRKTIRKSVALGWTSFAIFFFSLGLVGLLSRGTCTFSGTQKFNIMFTKVGLHGKYVIVLMLVVLTLLVGASMGSLLFAGLSMIGWKVTSWSRPVNSCARFDTIDSYTYSQSFAKISSARGTEARIGDPATSSTGERKRAIPTQHANMQTRDCIQTHLRSLCTRGRMQANAILACCTALIIGVSIVVYRRNVISTLANMFYMFNLLSTSLVFPVFAGLFLPLTNAGAISGAISGLISIFVWGVAEFGSLVAGMEMLCLMVFSSETLRVAVERRFATVDRYGTSPLLNQTVLDHVISAASLPPNNTFSAARERATPIYFDGVYYRAFVRTFSKEIQVYLDDPDGPWGTSSDVVFHPRTLSIFIMVPCVAFFVAVVVSRLDSKVNRDRAQKFLDGGAFLAVQTVAVPNDEEAIAIVT